MRRPKILNDAQSEPEHYSSEPYDYKLAWVGEQQRRQQESKTGWIYVGMDHGRPDRAKIGLTTGSPSTRDSSSQNPEFDIFCAFKIKDGIDEATIKGIENDIKAALSERYVVVPRVSTGNATEFYEMTPTKMREEVHDLLVHRHSASMYGFECPERGHVIQGWENERVIHGRDKGPYVPSDISNPPIAFECRTPPGCGSDDCNCWPTP